MPILPEDKMEKVTMDTTGAEAILQAEPALMEAGEEQEELP